MHGCDERVALGVGGGHAEGVVGADRADGTSMRRELGLGAKCDPPASVGNGTASAAPATRQGVHPALHAAGPRTLRRPPPLKRSARRSQPSSPSTGLAASAAAIQPPPTHRRRVDPPGRHVALRPFLGKQRRRVSAQVSRRALGQARSPLQTRQLTLHGAQHNRTHAAVVLTCVAPETFVEVVRDVLDVKFDHGMSIA